MSNPKFSVGEAVMIRSEFAPEQNCDFAIITFCRDHKGLNILDQPYDGWVYDTHNNRDNHPWCESSLRPIPPEKHNGICASEYIKNLTGVTV